MLRKNRGITLIALVITIVVLIILATVAINLSLGENGIFKRAKQAKEQYSNAQSHENDQVNELDSKVTKLTGNSEENKQVEPTYDVPYIPEGFTHIGTNTWNSGYTIKNTTTDDEFVWVPCILKRGVTSNTVITTPKGDEVITFGKTIPAKDNNGETITTDPNKKYNEMSLKLLPADTEVGAEDVSVSHIRESVGKYGGFYIAKYPAGIEGTTNNESLSYNNRKPSDGSYKPLSQPGKGVWDYVTIGEAITISKAMVSTTDNVKSTLISGECWDTTLKWMVGTSTNKTTNEGYDIDSTGRGNYNNGISTTGYSTGLVNNIYDMAGNIQQWSLENCTWSAHPNCVYIRRGGHSYWRGYDYPAAMRIGSDNSDKGGFRVVLYKDQ